MAVFFWLAILVVGVVVIIKTIGDDVDADFGIIVVIGAIWGVCALLSFAAFFLGVGVGYRGGSGSGYGSRWSWAVMMIAPILSVVCPIRAGVAQKWKSYGFSAFFGGVAGLFLSITIFFSIAYFSAQWEFGATWGSAAGAAYQVLSVSSGGDIFFFVLLTLLGAIIGMLGTKVKRTVEVQRANQEEADRRRAAELAEQRRIAEQKKLEQEQQDNEKKAQFDSQFDKLFRK